jgi:hypothetical protein
VTDTRHLVERHIRPVKISKPQPESLRAVATAR